MNDLEIMQMSPFETDMLRIKLKQLDERIDVLKSLYYHLTDPVRPWNELTDSEQRNILGRCRRAVEGAPLSEECDSFF